MIRGTSQRLNALCWHLMESISPRYQLIDWMVVFGPTWKSLVGIVHHCIFLLARQVNDIWVIILTLLHFDWKELIACDSAGVNFLASPCTFILFLYYNHFYSCWVCGYHKSRCFYKWDRTHAMWQSRFFIWVNVTLLMEL